MDVQPGTEEEPKVIFSYDQIIEQLQYHWSSSGTVGNTVLIRPGTHGFIESNEKDIAEMIQVIRMQKYSSLPFNALERLGFRLLVEGMGVDPFTGELK